MTHWEGGGDFLYGDHWLGPTFLSLVDPSDARLINTIRIRQNYESPEDEDFSVPFFTFNGFYYVPHPDKDGKGKPVLLHLRDFTGEGVAGQFALFDHVASGIAAGSVQGYSAKSDTAMQYPIEVIQDKFNPVVRTWATQVFDTKSSRPGYWKFTWEPGHGSDKWIDEEVRFDRARQVFVEKEATRPYPGSAHFHCDLDTQLLVEFLGQMQNLIHDEQEIQWLGDSIRNATPNRIVNAGMVPNINGTTQSFTVSYQTSASGAIAVDISGDVNFAAMLQAQLKPWCDGK